MPTHTTIISKVGSGEPSQGQLQQGEIGIDITNKVIWTYSQKDNKMVELAGGSVDWEQIEGIPPEIINIINNNDGNPNYIDLATLAAQVATNTGDIATLKGQVGSLETAVGGIEGQLIALGGLIQDNTDAIGGLASDVGANELAIDALEGRVFINEGAIGDNKSEIQRLEGLINNSLTGLVLGGDYDASSNTVAGLTNDGIDAGLRLDQPLPAPSSATKGIYVVVTVEGPLQGTGTKAPNREEDGTMAHVGDWLVSDGIHGWLLFELGQQDVTFGAIGGSPYDNQALEAALNEKISVGDTIDCGSYS